MKAAILDDEFDARDLLISMLKEIGGVQITGSYEHPHDAISGILMTRPDIIFIDIEMPALNGFEVLDALKGRDYHPTIIFVTAHNQFAIKAIKYAAFDYLLKPITQEELSRTLGRLKDKPQNELTAQLQRLTQYLKPDNRLKINTRTGYVLINIKDIVYCKADGNYTEIYLSNGKKEVVTMNLGSFHKTVSDYDVLNRIGRSLMINESYLYSVESKDSKLTFILPDSRYIEVNCAKSLMSQFIQTR